MADPLTLVGIAGSAAAVAFVAARERRALLAARGGLLSECAGLFSSAQVSHSHDGFPKLRGTWKGAPAIVTLFPDTLTARRLPQLWLSLTRPPVCDGAPVLDILVRPTGAEAYAFAASGLDRFEPPHGFPGETLIRGEGARAKALLEDLGHPLSLILSDPRVKEITFTPRATRLIWQAAEGNRGNHLILRQATFEDANVGADDMLALLTGLHALTSPLTPSLDLSPAGRSEGRAA